MDDKDITETKKHAGGRPLKFKTVKELQVKADAYFKDTIETEWTITGLALALDTTREVLNDYSLRDEFSDAVKRYKLMVQHAYEKDLRRKGRSGDIFALKNFGWTDRIETDITSKGDSLAATPVDAKLMTDFTKYLKDKTRED